MGQARALYAQAEQGGFASKPCAVYPAPDGESTVGREYLKALMHRLGKGCHYHVDLAVARAPARLVAQVSSAPTLRYFGPGTASDVAHKLIATIEGSGVYRSDLKLGGNYDSSLVVDVLQHLVRYWAPIPPTRADERHRGIARIYVAHDFDHILAIISGEGTPLSYADDIETWTVENESDGGYGAVIARSKGGWLKIGTLLAIKREDGAAWGVGIARRLTGSGQQRYVGIQTLAKGATRVKLFSVGASNAPVAGGRTPCCCPPAGPRAPARASSAYSCGCAASRRQSVRMRAYEREYLLVAKELLEGGEDFDMATFRVVRRAA